MKFTKKIAATLLGILCAGCFAGGLTACKAKGPTTAPENAKTHRLALPNDGSAPTAHTGLENIGYMAYALDKQEYYHAYAHASSKAMGYTQITQTWKDYNDGVMICSDLTHSSLVKAGTQACFVNNEVYMRTSETPGKSTTCTTAKWKTNKPTYYDRDKYLKTYGEFSTEISVYIINQETIKSWGEVTVNDDGTYSQTFLLNSGAASYYQYGMKTRGDLKGFPEFNSIEITFTFDGNWTVLSSYCEEKTRISPSSLGGIPLDSTSKVTTTFSYGPEQFDNEHFGYYESYYKQYIGNVNSDEDPEEDEVDIIKVLGSAFSGVLAGGEQFNAGLTLGQTEYSGKVFLSIASLEDVLGSIDARISLGKKDGRQDLYIGFAGGTAEVYYSDDAAMTLNIDALSTVINQFKDWISKFKNGGVSAASYALTDEEQESGGFDLSSVVGMLKEEHDDKTVTISIETDDLLGTGIGVRLYMHFDRESGTYIFNNIELESIAYGSASINLHAKITPDKNGEKISHNKAETPANLADYAAGVYSMLNSDSLKVTFDFDGSKQNVISMLQGLSVKADAYVELGYELATRVDLTVAYSGISAQLAVYYGNNIDFKSAGKIYLDLVKVNGEDIGAKVYCDIDKTVDAVKELIDLINGSVATAGIPAEQSEQAAGSVASIINGILNLNFGEVLGDVYASNSQIRVSADIDAIVNALDVNLNGIKFGTAALALGLEDGKTNLSLSLEALGLNMKVEGSSEQLMLPEKSEYLDAIEIIKLVSVAVKETGYITDAKAAAFDIDALVIIDGVPMRVAGSGEVSWANGLKIAVDALMTVADGTSAAQKDEVALRLLYDGNAGEGQPFIKFAVNQLGMEIYEKDISGTKNGIQHIIDNVNLLLNGEKRGNATASSAVNLYNGEISLDGGNVGAEIEEVVENNNLQKILSAVLGFVKDFSVSTDYNVEDGSVSKLIISHALCGNITLTANGGLALDANITDAEGAEICDVYAGVSAGNGAAFGSVNSAFDGLTLYSTAQTEDAFAKIVYNYLFAVVEEGLSVSQTLGSNTYEVAVSLDGGKSGIPALKNVKANANLYYTQGLAGDKIKGDKLAEIGLDLIIGNVTAQANVRYNNERIYISLERINNTKLSEVKFYAAKDDIASAVEELVKLITNDDLINTLANILNPVSGNSAVAKNENVSAQADGNAVSDLIAKLISFDFANTVYFGKVDGVNTASLNVDNLLGLFGTDLGFKIGTAKIGINPKTHAVSGSVSLDGRDWINLSAEVAESRVYESGWQNNYTDIGFVSNLLNDLIKTAVTDGKLNTLYTLGGNIDINISYSVISTSINIKNLKLTAGFDAQNDFYLSLTGDLQKTTYIGMTVAQNWKVAVTYSGGYVTLGRQVGTADEKFKVMTVDYLLANLLHKTESPIRWLIGTNDTVWGLIADNVKLNLGSNLTTPQEYWLYKENIPEEEPDETPAEITEFSLSQILGGMKVVLGGQERTESAFGNTDGILAGSGDYYGFNLNLQPLLGDVISNVYLTVLRSEEQGLTGLKVKTTVAGALTLNVNLDQGISTNADDAQPDYFKEVNAKHNINYNYFDGHEDPVTHISKTFGCFNTENGTSYASLDILGKVQLTVVGYGDAVQSQTVSLRSTSTVYLRDPENDLWADSGHTLMIVFVDENGNDLGYQTVITRDMTVYAKTVDAAEVVFDLGGVAENYTKGYTLEQQFEGYKGELTDKTFKNWQDKDGNAVTCAKEIPVINGERRAYANFVSLETAVNGVVYKAVSENGTVYYTADRVDGALDNKYVSDLANGGQYLMLESEINGIPVTRISANAFKATGLKNVIVPESITEVGAQAFMDNYGMENVVFAADTVKLYGNGTSGDNRYVFFGCSTASGGNNTKLNVYYNTINGEGDWTTFRSGSRIGTSAGGHLYAGGNWAYIDYVQSGADLTQGLNCLDGGVKLTGKTAEQIKNDVIAELNAKSESKGYINAYSVTVDGGIVMNGKINTVTVTLEESVPYRLLTINSNRLGAIVIGDIQVYNGNRYVKAGTMVTVNPPDGFVFESLTGIEHENGTFVMPDYALTLEAVCDNAPVSRFTLNSAVETFTMDGVEYHSGDTFKAEDMTSLSLDVAAQGYYFVGWAYNNGRELEFVSGENIEYSNYYAIWAVARDEIVSVTPVTEGKDPNTASVLHNAGISAGFEGWYTSPDYTTKVTSLSSADPLYARVYYTLSVQFSLKSNMYIYFNTEGDSEKQVESNSKSYTGTVKVLEGASVQLKDKESNGKTYSLISDGVVLVGDLRVKNRKTIIGTAGNTQALTPSCSDSGWVDANSSVKVTSDITFTMTCTY